MKRRTLLRLLGIAPIAAVIPAQAVPVTRSLNAFTCATSSFDPEDIRRLAKRELDDWGGRERNTRPNRVKVCGSGDVAFLLQDLKRQEIEGVFSWVIVDRSIENTTQAFEVAAAKMYAQGNRPTIFDIQFSCPVGNTIAAEVRTARA